MAQLLLIDDDRELCELLQDYLGAEGFVVEAAHSAAAGLARALSGEPSLVILDVMLPGQSGFEVLRQLRQESRVPVLMLTARGDDVDRIVGLEMGADDYLAKPFNPRELVARIRAIQRRSEPRTEPLDAPEPLALDDLQLDAGARSLTRSGVAVELTAVEFSLAELLLRHAGQVVSREELVRSVLGRRLTPYDRSIDVHMSSLRKKLGPGPAGKERIKTLRGLGYQMVLTAGGQRDEGR
jgi:two-component system, OmpR family, response regulator CpxR